MHEVQWDRICIARAGTCGDDRRKLLKGAIQLTLNLSPVVIRHPTVSDSLDILLGWAVGERILILQIVDEACQGSFQFCQLNNLLIHAYLEGRNGLGERSFEIEISEGWQRR